MTDLERAQFGLECWRAIEGWGVKTKVKIADSKVDRIEPWSWGERMKKADELYVWAMQLPGA